MTKKLFVITNIVLSQQNFCHDKHIFVVKKDMFCCNKHCDKTFVMTKMILVAALAKDSRNKHNFVATKMILVAAPASDSSVSLHRFFLLLFGVCGEGSMGGRGGGS